MDNINSKPVEPKRLRGVSCDVKSCMYHESDNYCTAPKIAVGPTYATSCTDTVCATFKQKNFGVQ